MSKMNGTYDIYIQGYDYGCGVNKVLVTLEKTINHMNKDYLKVTETKQVQDLTNPQFPVEIVKSERHIVDAYLCNDIGEHISESSQYVMIELLCSPIEGNPLLFNMLTQYNTYSKPYLLDIDYNGEWSIEKQYQNKYTCANAFTLESGIYEGVNYQYLYYQPDYDSKSLVVWLHGMGEGGTVDTDPYISVLANKVTALIGEEFQRMFNGVHVLVPQCPTYWMDEDGKASNFHNILIDASRYSYYTQSLHALIEDYKNKYHIEHVMIYGCSNGGYMTLLMGMDYPEEYQAIVPICEAMPDECISEDDLFHIKDLPMYFVYSKDDNVVDPTSHEIPTIKRLKNIGATDLHVSVSENVVDTTGQYFDEKHQPLQYMGHWSWIYFDNNACLGEDNMKVWEFMASRMLTRIASRKWN
ncbi:MAG: hypothetical protein LUF02_01265 [Erysipelotrichaceae bacterium]|nr:hypothetical protein [Erysipelotrichaceae bacterium]